MEQQNKEDYYRKIARTFNNSNFYDKLEFIQQNKDILSFREIDHGWLRLAFTDDIDEDYTDLLDWEPDCLESNSSNLYNLITLAGLV